ncbi:transposase, partial [Streptomyces sp. NPDC026665]|uniref:transposase n=1 Tax=Streptomyces sp. NPDC026665 TaxID=3154798 RepID=UPI0033DB445E
MAAGLPGSSGVRPHPSGSRRPCCRCCTRPSPPSSTRPPCRAIVSRTCTATRPIVRTECAGIRRTCRTQSGRPSARCCRCRPGLRAGAGSPRATVTRQMLDAIRYLVAGGMSWRAMSVDFPGWGRGYAFFRRWREHGLIAEFHDRLRG